MQPQQSISETSALHSDGKSSAIFTSAAAAKTIGPAQVRTDEIQNFTTLEDLIEHLLERDEFIQVVVNHHSYRGQV